MLRIAGRRYDRRALLRQAGPAASAVALGASEPRHATLGKSSYAFASSSSAVSAPAPASTVSAPSTSTSTEPINQRQQPPPARSSAGESGSTRIRSRPLFASSRSSGPRTLTRLPTPLPPDIAAQQLKDLLARSPWSSQQRAGQGQNKPGAKTGTATAARTMPSNGKGAAGQESLGTDSATAPSSRDASTADDLLQSLLAHDHYFPRSESVEQQAVLRTSLDAGLIWRASKVFEEIRSQERVSFKSMRQIVSPFGGRGSSDPAAAAEEAGMMMGSSSSGSSGSGLSAAGYNMRLSKAMYDDMLAAYLLKAAIGDDKAVQQDFWARARALFDDMIQAMMNTDTPAAGLDGMMQDRGNQRTTFDAPADINTAAIMMRGMARVSRRWIGQESLRPSPERDLRLPLSEAGIDMANIAKAMVWSLPPPRFEQQITDRAHRHPPSASADGVDASAEEGVGAFEALATPVDVLTALREQARAADENRSAQELSEVLVRMQKERERQLAKGGAHPLTSSHPNFSDEDSLRPEDRKDLPALEPTKTTSPASRYLGDLSEAELEEVGPDTAGPSVNLVLLQENLGVVQQARTKFSDPYQRQTWLEESGVMAARKRLQFFAKQSEENPSLSAITRMGHHQLQRWMWEWYQAMEVRLKEELAAMRDYLDGIESSAAGYSDRRSIIKRTGVDADEVRSAMEQRRLEDAAKELYPFLISIPVSRLALVPVLEVMRLVSTTGVSDGLKMTRACVSLGRTVESEAHIQAMKRRDAMIVKAGRDGSTTSRTTSEIDKETSSLMQSTDFTSPEARRRLRRVAEDTHWESPQGNRWTQSIRARIGSHLIYDLLEVATIKREARDRLGKQQTARLPAFIQSYQYMAGKRLGVLKVNEYVGAYLEDGAAPDSLHPRHLPMLVPPKPWTSHESGGYYRERTSAMRFKDSAEQNSYLKKASERGDLDNVLAGLDVLGRTPWRINRRVFDVMGDVWNQGIAFAKIPPRSLADEEPQPPANYETDMKAKNEYLQKLRFWAVQQATNHGLRCDINYKLEIARAFIGERFYFPHNIDFRGRAYPIPPNFNHIGNDLCRGLLKFDVAKPLGTSGLRWLRIHLANLYGFDKASFSEREQWAIDHEAQIRESAENPLNGSRWWLKAGDPWQCLATCMELIDAYDHPEGPEKFESSLPVHQDGTCNGLQHYAALGGDLAGAKQVNLAVGDKPADVYTGVAEMVISKLDADAAAGHEPAQLLQGKITRKVVKQTVMTTVYGVTFIGAKKQIARQLIDRGDIQYEKIYATSSYLAKTVLSEIGNLFAGATSIQTWLHDAARLISKSIPPERIRDAMEGREVKRRQRDDNGMFVRAKDVVKNISREQMTSVIWTTGLGLPVVQPYRKAKKKQMASRTQSLFITDPQVNHEVSPQKQASAFPPNFIHSLDATHMLLTALECHRAGLTFASVHDSYWTHACDIDTMSDFIRETFVDLHSKNILSKLREEFLERFGDYLVPIVVLKNLGSNKLSENAVVEPLANPDAESLSGQETTVALGMQKGSETEEDDLAESEDADDAVKDAAAESASDADDEVASELSADDGAEDAEESEEKKPRTRKTKWSQDELVSTKFVPLKDILPVLPPKGTFDVNEIRKSLYFFS